MKKKFLKLTLASVLFAGILASNSVMAVQEGQKAVKKTKADVKALAAQVDGSFIGKEAMLAEADKINEKDADATFKRFAKLLNKSGSDDKYKKYKLGTYKAREAKPTNMYTGLVAEIDREFEDSVGKNKGAAVDFFGDYDFEVKNPILINDVGEKSTEIWSEDEYRAKIIQETQAVANMTKENINKYDYATATRLYVAATERGYEIGDHLDTLYNSFLAAVENVGDGVGYDRKIIGFQRVKMLMLEHLSHVDRVKGDAFEAIASLQKSELINKITEYTAKTNEAKIAENRTKFETKVKQIVDKKQKPEAPKRSALDAEMGAGVPRAGRPGAVQANAAKGAQQQLQPVKQPEKKDDNPPQADVAVQDPLAQGQPDKGVKADAAVQGVQPENKAQKKDEQAKEPQAQVGVQPGKDGAQPEDKALAKEPKEQVVQPEADAAEPDAQPKVAGKGKGKGKGKGAK